MLDSNYVEELDKWLWATLEEINSLIAAIRTLDDVKITEKRIRNHISDMKQKKREISIHMKEVRLEYDQEEPYNFLFFKQTRKQIENERDRHLLPWKKTKVVIDDQIGEMKRLLFEIAKQVNEQT